MDNYLNSIFKNFGNIFTSLGGLIFFSCFDGNNQHFIQIYYNDIHNIKMEYIDNNDGNFTIIHSFKKYIFGFLLSYIMFEFGYVSVDRIITLNNLRKRRSFGQYSFETQKITYTCYGIIILAYLYHLLNQQNLFRFQIYIMASIINYFFSNFNVFICNIIGCWFIIINHLLLDNISKKGIEYINNDLIIKSNMNIILYYFMIFLNILTYSLCMCYSQFSDTIFKIHYSRLHNKSLSLIKFIFYKTLIAFITIICLHILPHF